MANSKRSSHGAWSWGGAVLLTAGLGLGIAVRAEAAPEPSAAAAPSAATAAAAPAATAAARAPLSFTILHTNDMHGHLLSETDKKVAPEPEKVGGAAFMAAYVERERAAHPGATLLIDAGDIAQGTPLSNLFVGKPMVEFMNEMHYDAGTIGNHEFDWGPMALADLVRWSDRPIVCANLRLKQSGLPPAGVRDFVVKTVQGVRIGIAGLVTPKTVNMSFAKNMEPFTFVEPAEAMKKILPRMKQAGCEMIIVASHLGDEDDVALAKAVPGIHVIVGGHAHKAIPEPVIAGDTIIVQAGKYMRYLGELTIKYDRATAKVVDYSHKNVLIPVYDSRIQPDPKVAAIVKKYADQIGPAMAQVVGQSVDDLTKSTTSTTTDNVLGNVITDSLRWKSGADIAVYNAGGIRSEINRGPIRMSDVYTLLPFDNVMVTLQLSGAQVQRLFEQGLGQDQGAHGTIQISGASFVIAADGKVTDVKINGQALDPSRTYRVSTVDFLAEGNDGLTVLKEGKGRVYDELARDVFCGFVRKAGSIKAPATGRITRIKPLAPAAAGH
jgi:2',3'-cyclic-nucleotide 2'-phosphodiesterase (5'-nucleotidase family)